MAAPAEPAATFEVILASTEDGGIGYRGTIPWRLPSDLDHFRSVTTQAAGPGRRNAVIMGRRTWASLPRAVRPLPRRINVVVSSEPEACRVTESVPDGVDVADSLDAALAAAASHPDLGRVFIIGGARLYREAMASPRCARIHWTRVFAHFECDTFVPPADPKRFEETGKGPILGEGGIAFRFVTLEPRPSTTT